MCLNRMEFYNNDRRITFIYNVLYGNEISHISHNVGTCTMLNAMIMRDLTLTVHISRMDSSERAEGVGTM